MDWNRVDNSINYCSTRTQYTPLYTHVPGTIQIHRTGSLAREEKSESGDVDSYVYHQLVMYAVTHSDVHVHVYAHKILINKLTKVLVARIIHYSA